MDPNKVIASILAGWATAWALTALGVPAIAVIAVGFIVGAVTGALLTLSEMAAAERLRRQTEWDNRLRLAEDAADETAGPRD